MEASQALNAASSGAHRFVYSYFSSSSAVLLRDSGNSPEKSLRETSSRTSVDRAPSSSGSLPARLLEETSSVIRLSRPPSASGSVPVSPLVDRSSAVRLFRRPNSSGSLPASPFALKSSPHTRPTESVSTPCQPLALSPSSQPSALVQFAPPVASYRDRSTSRSSLPHTEPAKNRSLSAQAANSAVPGRHRRSLPSMSKKSGCRFVKPAGTTPSRLLSPTHSPTRLSSSANSSGNGPLRSLSLSTNAPRR